MTANKVGENLDYGRLVAWVITSQPLEAVDGAKPNLKMVGASFAELFDGFGVAFGELALLR